jgi:hypothetical protein
LGAALDRTESFSALGLTQAVLGLCAATAAFVGIFSFVFQIGDAFWISKKRKINNRRGMRESGHNNATAGSERNVVFDFDFLSQADNHVNENSNNNNDDDDDDEDVLAALERELRDMAAAATRNNTNNNNHIHTNRPNLNDLLDDENDLELSLLPIGQRNRRRTKIGPNGEVIYVLDDDDENALGSLQNSDLDRTVQTGGKNADLEMRKEELSKFFSGENGI